IAFGITPVACVYYPATALPGWLQPVAMVLPAAHVFAGMRAGLFQHAADWPDLAQASALNLGWMLLAIVIFGAEFRRARVRGALISIGE
ncbi:MAG: ABC transporter permease, partial [Acidocella sp.]|nr:ABC transporter permease [Acidocella sp.]